MDLKRTDHLRNTISLLYYLKVKNRVKIRYLDFFSEKIHFGLHFAENRQFQVGDVFLRHCDVLR